MMLWGSEATCFPSARIRNQSQVHLSPASLLLPLIVSVGLLLYSQDLAGVTWLQSSGNRIDTQRPWPGVRCGMCGIGCPLPAPVCLAASSPAGPCCSGVPLAICGAGGGLATPSFSRLPWLPERQVASPHLPFKGHRACRRQMNELFSQGRFCC